MRRRFLFALAILVGPAATFGQSAPSDSQTLQALLKEVRDLRQDLRGSLVKLQSAQILIARLQMEETALDHAQQRFDDARSKLTEVQSRETHISANITRLQDTLSSDDSGLQKPQIEGALDDLRSELEATKTEESQRQTAEIEAEQQLHAEQGKLGTMEAQLDEIVKGLDNAGVQSGPTSH